MGIFSSLKSAVTGGKDYTSIYEIYKKSAIESYDKYMRMASERFNVKVNDLPADQKIQLFEMWAKSYFKLDELNEEYCLPERYEEYKSHMYLLINEYGTNSSSEIISRMCMQRVEETKLVDKWK